MTKVSNALKCYISVFICFVTKPKAIYLELVSDLSTDALLAALRRFIARLRKSMKFYSDNAASFVGAHSELRKIIEGFTFDEIIQEFPGLLFRETLRVSMDCGTQLSKGSKIPP